MESNRSRRFPLIAALGVLAASAFIVSSKSSKLPPQELQAWEVQLDQNAQANSTLTIRNQCQQPHSFTVTAQGVAYLQLPAAANINVPGRSIYNLPVRFDTKGLTPGEYRATVIVKCNDCDKERTCKQDIETLQLRLTVKGNQPSPSTTPLPSPSTAAIPTATPQATPSATPGSMPIPAATSSASPSPCGSPPPPTTYSVKDLKTLPTIDGSPSHCVATGINDLGNVSGGCLGKYKGGPSSGGWRAFRTSAAGAVITPDDELSFPAGFSGGTSFAMATNAFGHVVGWWSAGDVKAFWHEGTKPSKMINLHPSKSPFTTSRAFALNIHEVIVGAAYGSSVGPVFFGPTFDGHAVIWSTPAAASMKDLNDDLPFSLKADWTLNSAFAINDDGDIVGRALNKKLGKHHAFLLKSGVKFVDLGAIKEGAADSSAAYAINECADKLPAIDKVVGYTFTKKDSFYGFVWTEAAGMTDIGTLSSYPEGYAKAINKKGEIVGAAGSLHTSIVFDGITCFGTCFTTPAGKALSHAVWYNGIELKDLNTLIPDYPGYEIEVANGINSDGKIVGSAFFKSPSSKSGLFAKAVLLVPAGPSTSVSTVSTSTAAAAGSKTTSSCPASAPAKDYIFDNWNVCPVKNGPLKDTTFTISKETIVTFIATYHWNSGAGALAAGKGISVKDSAGKIYGPWIVTTSPGSGGAPNANWECHPGILLPAGTYTVIDPDPATWSQNDASGGSGFVRVAGSAK